MIKHIGKHNNRKVVVLFRQIPGEDHMCLIVYSDQLPHLVHDELMKTLESQIGQQSDNFADALFRQTLADGRNALEVLHREGYMKKVQTGQVIMTPNASSAVRLDELNTILSEMSKGEDAIKRLAELDKMGGLVGKKPDPAVVKEVMDETAPVTESLETFKTEGVLSDADIAAQQLAQATRMRGEANALLAEAARLEGEAAALVPAPAVVKKPRGRTKATATTTTATKTTKKVTKNDSAEKASKV